MNECSGKNFVLNGTLQPAELFDKSLVYEGESIYEVLRMMKGCPVFFADHIYRLTTSVRLQKKELLADLSDLKKAIISLIRSDKRKESNIKIVFNYNNGVTNYLVYYLEPAYPTELQYRQGVKGILFHGERKDPESKVIQYKLKTSVSNRLLHERAYEAILVNESSLITEGSRTNIFFLSGSTLVTAPDNVILNGITRKHILELCAFNDIEVRFFCVHSDDISKYDAVFMTGTSPVVLPFYCIDNTTFRVNFPVIEKLRQLYIRKAEDSIGLFRSE
jgi:branched-chain amino acid aminotransferase